MKTMKHLILNDGKLWNKNFNIGGFIIPQFSEAQDAKRFNSIDDAQNVLNEIPSQIASDCKIVIDIWNL
jgi:hypothetical protein